jgi:hypothetical protein
MTDQLSKALNDLIPKSLDEIVTLHRDECILRPSIAEDLARLKPMDSTISEQKPDKGTIDDWRIIAASGTSKTLLFLTGTHRSKDVPYMTSDIVSIDGNTVVTNNSVYHLGVKGEGEPDMMIILHICATLHYWGAGAYLGVPYIFY